MRIRLRQQVGYERQGYAVAGCLFDTCCQVNTYARAKCERVKLTCLETVCHTYCNALAEHHSRPVPEPRRIEDVDNPQAQRSW